MRIVFFGTPDFAVASLNALVEAGREVCLVVTTPDKPVGRHQNHLQPSAVKTYALEHGLPLVQPSDLSDPDFVGLLDQVRPDVGIVVAFRKLPRQVWSLPRLGTFNVHGSLLPLYRGAAPINWAIINGEKETGVTTFMLDDHIDTGEILLSRSLAIAEDDTFGDVYDRLSLIGAELALDTLRGIEQGTLRPTPQAEPDPERSRAPKLNRDNTRIDWTRSPQEIHNLVRGLSPQPAAYTFVGDGAGQTLQLKIYRTSPMVTDHNYEVGTIVGGTAESIRIAISGGYIDVLELQLAGKRRMTAGELLRGNRAILGMKLEVGNR